MTKIYEIWKDRLASGVITYGQMRQFVMAVGGWWWNGDPRGAKTLLTAEEAEDLYFRLKAMPDGLDLVGDYRGKGYRDEEGVWHLLTWKQFGRRWVAENGRRSGVMPDMVAAASELDFRFVGIEPAGNNFVPIYRAFTPDGRSWRYAPSPWQVKVYA